MLRVLPIFDMLMKENLDMKICRRILLALYLAVTAEFAVTLRMLKSASGYIVDLLLMSQAQCVITYVKNTRGVLLQNSWAGKCLEPPDNCPTSCDIRVVGTMTFQTCYKCDVDETCKGSFLLQRFSFKPFCDCNFLYRTVSCKLHSDP